MMEIILQRNSKNLVRKAVGDAPLTLGRSEENSIVLTDPEISRQHCVIEKRGSALVLRDLSKNGTLVNGEMKREAILALGDSVSVGPWTLRVADGSDGAREKTVACSPCATRVIRYDEAKRKLTTEEVELVAHVPGREPAGKRFSSGEITIGSLASCDLRVDDPCVSRRHCQMSWSGESLTLTDLGSTNGTFLSNRRISSAALGSSGNFCVGQTKIDFKVERQAERVSVSRQARLGRMVGPSLPMRELFALIEKVAPSDATVCITGESGTGKELVARELHDRSRRRRGPFVALNCGALPASIIESVLFGHERGAFTGATERTLGLIEQAKGGTLFLDEIGEMPEELQTRLLRVLESRSLRRGGGDAEIPVDVRIFAATNRNLKELVRDGRFREDLFFRLYVVHLFVPPLRERQQDARALAIHFASELSGGARDLTEAALSRIEKHSWPGNARELRNTIERALLFSDGGPIDSCDIDIDSLFARQGKNADLRSRESSIIAAALDECRGNLSRTSRKLGIARTTLQKKVKRYGIEIPRPDEETVPAAASE